MKIHKLVAREWVNNPEEKSCVDHLDGDRTNNNHRNLRAATRAENMRNRRNSANTTSIYYGVCWCKGSNKWKALIQIGEKRKGLGYFTDENEAAAVFNATAVVHYKEFAKLSTIND